MLPAGLFMAAFLVGSFSDFKLVYVSVFVPL